MFQFQIWAIYANTQTTTTQTTPQKTLEQQKKDQETIDEMHAFLQMIQNMANGGLTINSLTQDMSKREAMKQLWFSDSSIDFFDKILWEFKQKIWNWAKQDTYKTVNAYRYIIKSIWKKKTDNQRRNHILDYLNYTFQEYLDEYEQQLPYFQNVSYDQLWNGVWEVRAEIPRTHTEVWFYFWNNTHQAFQTQKYGRYLMYLQAWDGITSDFAWQLYIKDKNGNYKYYQSNQYLAYEYNDSIQLANTGIEINGITDELRSGYRWTVRQVQKWAVYVWDQISKVDVSKHLRNFDNLDEQYQEDFYEWFRDTLTLNGMYDVALNIVAWIWIWKVFTIIKNGFFKKFGAKVAAKLWARVIPLIWWAMFWYSAYQVWDENVRYYGYCSKDLSFRKDGKSPLYYCGKVMVNGAFIAAWMWISKVHSVGAFKIKFRSTFKNWNFAEWMLDYKYDKHVIRRWEWSVSITKEQYLSKSRELLSSQPNSNIIEHITKNGFILKYNKVTNEFATWKPDGTIETFYRPNRWYEYVKEQFIKYP